jgi:regulator of replication initiation timing
MVKASAVDLEPIDRLAQKVELLVKVLERSRAEQARLVEDNTRLSRELEATRGRLAAAEGDGAEMRTLKAERDQIRSRVSEMLEQLEGLSV